MKMPFPIPIDKKYLHSRWKVRNPFSGQSCSLPYYAKRVYEMIKQAEVQEDYKTMRKGLDWFSRNFTKEYYILLD